MHIVDLTIIILYLCATALIPVIVAKRQKSKEDFMMAGRRMHWLPLALSGVAASFSAISLLGVPGFVLAHDLKYLPTLFVGILSIPVVFFLVVPFLYKLRLVSVYEYLETRFCPGIRYAASALFMVSKLGYLAMAIFTPSLALNSITGLPIALFIVILGAVTAFYTMLGGMESVVWCDVMLFFVMIFGIGGVVFFFGKDIPEYWSLAAAAGKTRTFDFSFDLGTLSIWVLFLNCTLMGVAGVCSDQSQVQRLLSARSLKDSMKSYFFSIVFGAPVVLVLYLIGISLFGFFKTAASLPPGMDAPDKVFPFFISRYLPPGVAGLLLAAILAAGMSTINVVLHSLTSLFMVDVYEKLSGNRERGAGYVWISRLVLSIWGALATGLAFFVMYLGSTIIEVTQVLAALLAAPLGGIFFLGIFTQRANAMGAVSGGIAGILATVGAWYCNRSGIMAINFMWFAVFGIAVTCAVGYAVSMITGSSTKKDVRKCE